jgi:glycosyltransferase involved in cell wall biosynthesis
MVTAPRITVITVTLNAALDLPLTLESVLGQTYPHLETLLVDGCSWDNTSTVLNRYRDRLSRIMTIEDGGIYQAMNTAVQVATYDYVLFLNAGDRFYGAGTVEAMVARMAGQPDVFYGDHIYVEGRVERFTRSTNFDWLWQRLEQGRIDQKWHTAIPCHQATFTRTRWLRDMPYDTRYAICADHDFLFRAQAAARACNIWTRSSATIWLAACLVRKASAFIANGRMLIANIHCAPWPSTASFSGRHRPHHSPPFPQPPAGC